MSDDTGGDPGWLVPKRAGQAAEELVLVVLWCIAEPARVGQTMALEGRGPWAFGRGDGEGTKEARASLFAARPGPQARTKPLQARGVSRRHLEISREEGGAGLGITRVGKANLFLNGRRVDDATVHAGDTIAIEGELVLLCVSRPSTPFLASAKAPTFAFGAPDPSGIVGESVATWRLRDAITFVSGRADHVLVLGASGTGKELVANAIHQGSPRAKGPLVSRSAATLPAGLVDAELFGNPRNYPHQGMPERKGLIGEAHGGTLFLDELGEMPLEVQAHLLRVLDKGEYQRLGEGELRRSDFRLIAATNRDPSELKHDLVGRFGLRIETPGLDRRREDIPFLARHLLRTAAATDTMLATRFFEPDGEPRLSPDLMVMLVRASYSTHIRELKSMLWISMEKSPGHYLDLVPELSSLQAPIKEDRGNEPLGKDEIEVALRDNARSVSRAAAALGLKNRAALYRLMKKHGIE